MTDALAPRWPLVGRPINRRRATVYRPANVDPTEHGLSVHLVHLVPPQTDDRRPRDASYNVRPIIRSVTESNWAKQRALLAVV